MARTVDIFFSKECILFAIQVICTIDHYLPSSLRWFDKKFILKKKKIYFEQSQKDDLTDDR